MGSPESNQVHYIRVRPVPRLEERSEVAFTPETAEKETETIALTVKPKLKRLNAGLRLRATVEILDNDNRLSLIDNSTVTEEIEILANSNTARSLVFQYKRISQTNYDSLKFNVTLEYSLAYCTDTYQKPCPVFDSEDYEMEDHITDEEGQKITKKMPTKTLMFNICKDPNSCQCELGTVIEQAERIIAGKDRTIRLGNLKLSNTGSEASHSTNFTVTIIDSVARLRFPGTENGICRQEGILTRSCIIFVEKNTDMPIEVIPVNTIKPEVKEITLSVTVMDHCKGRNNTFDKTLTIPVVHQWTLKPELTTDKDSQVSWNYDSQETTLSKSLEYTITNKGPSISSKTHLYVYLPKHRFIENTIVEFDGETCTEGDTQTPPAVPPSSGDQKMKISCTQRGDCLVYQCEVNQTEKDNSKPLRVRYEFNHKEAQEKSEDVTEFSVVTSVCVQQADQTQECSQAGETLTTRSEFIYYPATTLDIIYSHWQIIVAVAATVLVFVTVVLLAWKFNLFQRARIVRNQEEDEVLTNEATEPIALEMT